MKDLSNNMIYDTDELFCLFDYNGCPFGRDGHEYHIVLQEMVHGFGCGLDCGTLIGTGYGVGDGYLNGDGAC